MCSTAEINQVFIQLLTNAIQAIQQKGAITVRTFASGGKVYVQVADTGRGIPVDQMGRLFDPVFSHKGRRVKASLGLFTCSNIIEKHGGEIKVESALDKGSTFTVILPTAFPEDVKNEISSG